MGLHIGSTAPDFTQESTDGTIQFHEWLGDSWGILFSHPADFTPVCTTELGMVARTKEAFDARDCKTIALSVDPVDAHRGWVSDIEETQDVKMNFPILADADRTVSTLYDMIHAEAGDTSTVRSVFIIDATKTIRATLTYPKTAGRNFDEILRLIDSMQLTDKHAVATPANWKTGDEVVIAPNITDADELAKRFPKGHRELKPYLRLTPQPDA